MTLTPRGDLRPDGAPGTVCHVDENAYAFPAEWHHQCGRPCQLGTRLYRAYLLKERLRHVFSV